MKKENLPIIIGIMLPILLIITFIVVIYLPQIFSGTSYNFIYTLETPDYNRGVPQELRSFSVVDGRLSYNGPVRPNDVLYLYDTKNHIVTEITFEQAQEYNLQQGPSSPDGYVVEYQYNYAGIFDLFGSSNNSGYFLVRGNYNKRLTGLPRSNFRSNFRLLGWIK